VTAGAMTYRHTQMPAILLYVSCYATAMVHIKNP